jgi:hypothetical protein
MRPILLLSVLTLIITHNSSAQTYDSYEYNPESGYEMNREDIEFESEFVPKIPDEEYGPGEIERQEEVLYPEGEPYDWSLGGEDLPAEEYE